MRIHALVVTYRRPAQLAVTLAALDKQTRRPDSLTIVDNGADDALAVPAADFPDATIVTTEENLGPAGGLHRGVLSIAARCEREDWVIFVDDDDPPLSPITIERLECYAHNVVERLPDVAAVGVSGARYNRRTGNVERVGDDDIRSDVTVDFIGGNQYPLYRVAALTAIRGPREELFFGFDDLDLGLRLQEAGYTLRVEGGHWLQVRRALERDGLSARAASRNRRVTDWRRYYSSRNLIDLARRHGAWTAPILATLRFGPGRAASDVLRRRSLVAARPPLRGALDAWRSRLGRTVSP